MSQSTVYLQWLNEQVVVNGDTGQNPLQNSLHLMAVKVLILCGETHI